MIFDSLKTDLRIMINEFRFWKYYFLEINLKKQELEERLIDFEVLVIEIVRELPDNKVANHLAGQLVRSGTSPAFNYSEAQSSESRKDFIK